MRRRLLLPSRRWLLPILLLLQLAAQVQAGEIRGRVDWVYDGDTVRIEGVGKVRLLGIDTPESEASERDRAFRRLGADPKSLRRIAKEALRFNIETAKGKVVVLRTDREERDRHGRLLAYVTLPDGRLLNRLLLEQGYAAVYRRFDFRLKEDFLAAEAEARQAGRGLWKK